MLVVLEVGTRTILHYNITAHPAAEWTAQQFHEAIPSDHSYRFLIHDRDSIFAKEVDQTIENLGLKIVRMPVWAPQANAHCERLIGTIRHECLDFMIPVSERHLRKILSEWVIHYKSRRPHRSQGPGLPVPNPTSRGNFECFFLPELFEGADLSAGYDVRHWPGRKKERTASSEVRRNKLF